MSNTKIKGYIYVLISSFGFSLVPLLAKYSLDNGMNSETMLTYRFVIAGLFFILFTRLKGYSLKVPSKDRIKLIGLGALYALESAIFFEAFKHISPGFGQLLFQINPMMVAVAGFFILKEKLTKQKITALILVITGCCLLFWEPQSYVTMKGVILVVLAATFYTSYVIIGKETLENTSPIVVTTYLTTSCAGFLLVYGFVTSSLRSIPTVEVGLSIGILTLLSTIVAILAFSIGLKILEATVASILCATEPVITVALSYFIYGEALNAIQFIGAIFIVISIVVIDFKFKKDKDVEASSIQEI